MDVIETELKETNKELKETKKMVVNSNFVKEKYAVDIRYVDESEGLRMIVDSGAPMSIVSAGWLEKYLKEMEVDARDVEEESCNRRFRFCEKVWKSYKEVTMPIFVKVGDEDYVRKNISVNVIDREKD